MKPEGRSSFINRSFRRSFRRLKKTEEPEKSPEEIKADQEKALSELQESVKDVLDPTIAELNLPRFLKARNYDVPEAEKLVRLHVNSVKFLMLDDYSEDQLPEVYKLYHFGGFLGFDKDGSPVRLFNYGMGDIMGFMHCLSTYDVIRILLFFLRKDIKSMQLENEKTGKKADQIVYIVNMEHFNGNQIVQKPVIDTALFGLKLLQDHCHDIYKHVFVINAPSIFTALMKILKPAMQESLLNKLKIFGTDKWQQALQEHMNADILPVYYGGTRVDSKGDPKCSEFIGFGGEIPQSFYWIESGEEFDPNDPDVKSVVVGPGASLNIPVKIKEAGEKVRFCISSKDNDMCFGIFFEPPNLGCETPMIRKKGEHKDHMKNLEPLIPLVRCQCQLTPVVGHTITPKSGTYIMHLDNSYSWMNPKEVLYKIVVEPKKI